MSRGYDHDERDWQESEISASRMPRSQGRGGGDSTAAERSRPRPSRAQEREHPPRLRTDDRDDTRARGQRYDFSARERDVLRDVGRFRTVAVDDLLKYQYGGKMAAMRKELIRLQQQGLLQKRSISVGKNRHSLVIVTLTREGARIARQDDRLAQPQAVYAGFVKPAEVPHDAAIYQMYQAEARQIEGRGGNPVIFFGIRYAYQTMLFSTPFIACAMIFSLLYIFLVRPREVTAFHPLPPYPDLAERDRLFLVVGEVHHPKRPEPVEEPQWLTIPDRGLYTGIAVFGAIGSGKTSCCMYPFAEQILSYRAGQTEQRPAGLVLEVKGDFCYKVRQILKRHGRQDDYFEISLDCPYRYNPLHNDMEAYALAYGIASLLNNLFGRGKEPFWQQAYTNLVKFIILLHKVNYDYVTLFDVYECAINPDKLEMRIKEGERLYQTEEYVLVADADYVPHRELTKLPFQKDSATGEMKAPISADLLRYLDQNRIPYSLVTETGGNRAATPEHARKREQLEAVKRWFYHDWRRIEPKLRTSIVEGISVFLSLFDDNPSVKATFCPPKECYDPELNRDGRYGIPMPTFTELLEQGKVCALNFPVAMNPGLARTIGTLMKQDFQRAVLNRIPHMEIEPGRHWREILFLCDEYQSFATVGESDPTGDEKFFALSRQARCIPIVATQSISSLRSTLPGESWRTLMQTFRTKIFLALSDDFSARTASEFCGKEEQLKLSYSLSENDQDARVSVLTGRATAHKATISTSKSYNLQRDWIFEAKVFSELKNAQSIVLAYDGVNPMPASYCYLKPYYLDPNKSYFMQLADREI